MHPILFTIGPVTLYTYGAMMVAGFLTTTWLAGRFAKALAADSRAINKEQIIDFTCYSLMGGIIGGRILYVALQPAFFARHPWEVFALWHGGLVWYGGFFGGLITGYWYIRSRGLRWLCVLDQFIPFGALGHAIGRIGCFFNGCCYGKPTDSWCGVFFPGHAERVLPTQLFETLGLCLLFVLLRKLQTPVLLRKPGAVFSGYLIGYGLLRFILEFTRGDQQIWLAGMTLQQAISLALILAGTVLISQLPHRRENKNRPR